MLAVAEAQKYLAFTVAIPRSCTNNTVWDWLNPFDQLGIETAIGCIPVATPQDFIAFVLRWAMGIAGGIALALIGYAGFMIITSMGNPQRLQAGKELLTSAVSGLMLLLFGIFALRFIGIEILKIPGFGA